MNNYLVDNPLGIGILQAIDALLPECRQMTSVPTPASLLISNLAHIGDAVITTSILKVLKEASPEMKIGVLCGSWNKAVFEDHPCVDWVHTVDHWKLNRAQLSLWKKYQLYRTSYLTALDQIRQTNYDAAIDLYPYFPNSIHLLWNAKIPVRIGYRSGGFGPLLTHSLPTLKMKMSAAENSFHLIKKFLPLHFPQFSGRPFLAADQQRTSLFPEKSYIVFHMGTGHALKEWPEEKWRELTQALTSRGETLIFTGRGKKETERVQRVMHGFEHVHDLSDRLGWQDFVLTIAKTRFLVSVDSVSVHIASAFEIPTVVLFSGINPIELWKPSNPNCQVLMRPLPCAPCLSRKGCPSMGCIRDISVQEVLQAIERLTS
jgi:ADP-heptose:LPS heptosyltransferase